MRLDINWMDELDEDDLAADRLDDNALSRRRSPNTDNVFSLTLTAISTGMEYPVTGVR